MELSIPADIFFEICQQVVIAAANDLSSYKVEQGCCTIQANYNIYRRYLKVMSSRILPFKGINSESRRAFDRFISVRKDWFLKEYNRIIYYVAKDSGFTKEKTDIENLYATYIILDIEYIIKKQLDYEDFIIAAIANTKVIFHKPYILSMRWNDLILRDETTEGDIDRAPFILINLDPKRTINEKIFIYNISKRYHNQLIILFNDFIIKAENSGFNVAAFKKYNIADVFDKEYHSSDGELSGKE